MQSETRSSQGSKHYGVSNICYDLMTVIHEKSKGLEAFDQYMQDAQGHDQVMKILKQCRQNDQQAIEELMQCLQTEMGHSHATAGSGSSSRG